MKLLKLILNDIVEFTMILIIFTLCLWILLSEVANYDNSVLWSRMNRMEIRMNHLDPDIQETLIEQKTPISNADPKPVH